MGVADPHLMLAFEGTDVPDWLQQRLREAPPAGVTLFREWNMTSPAQVAGLTSALQDLNSAPHPLLIAVDQEGGQLLGLTGSTPFAGNMALGATGDPDLARAVARAMGDELRAVGINVNYAPVADVATRADNPSLGVRSFGDDPALVASLTARMVEGLAEAGILSTLKHFPGKGEARVDPHYELPRLDLDRERLEQVELPPFRAGIEAGANLLMTGHYVVPAITGSDELPISVSGAAIDGFIRTELGFGGVVTTDALDMGALDQGPSQVVDIITMMRGGTDLLLCMPDPDLQSRVRVAVERGSSRGLIPPETLARSRARIERLRAPLPVGDLRPGLVGGEGHRQLAAVLAEGSVTLVRNDDGVLPLRNAGRILALEPVPSNVTPADTTALYEPQLATALRTRHPAVTEIVYPHTPASNDIDSAVDAAEGHDVIVVGTVNAAPGQGELVAALLAIGKPVITVALRTPYDLAVYPQSATHVCTYGGHLPSLEALTAAVFGDRPFRGRLPAAIPGLYPPGHGIEA